MPFVLASAQATDVSYIANDAPGNSDDGIDQQNSDIVQVWTQTQSPTGGSGGYYPNWASNGWDIYSYPISNVSGSITETHTFAGGPLAVGQTVSLLWGTVPLPLGKQSV